MKKIILTYNYPPTIGGIETYSYNLFKHLQKIGGYKFIFPKKKKPNNLYFRAINLIFYIFKISCTSVFSKYSLFHITSFNLWPAAMFYQLFHRNCKILINIWGLELVYENKKGLIPKIYKTILPFERISNNKNIHFLISSDASRELLNSLNISQTRIHYLTLGVDTSGKSIQKVDTPKKYFLFVGRNAPRKGMAWFSNEVLKHYKDFKMYAVGPIVDKNELHIAQKNPQFEHLGVVTPEVLSKLRRESFCTIVPNIYLPNNDDFEAFCFATIEAVIDSSIVLASDYQGISDALRDGLLGYMSLPSNTESWRKTIDSVLKMSPTERQLVIKERFQIVYEELNWELIIEKTKKLHLNLLENVNE